MGELVLSSQEVIDVEVETEEDREKDKRKKRKKENDGSSQVVRWEAFLPRMVLRVLLVEADDSTRQIIAALLRKCSYRVAAVPDGLMAWETLKGRPQNIDIILTEVELPSISGFALLTLVMEHDACKNIPVIMMSSQDSISMVLKCMLKGAADFLIKPVRRNELRNLWQHVWRRQTLSGGHVHQSLPVSQPKDEATSGNNESRNQSSEHANSAQKDEECREKESDVPGLKQVKCSSASNLSNNCTGKHVEHVKSNKTLVLMECDTGGKFDRLGSEVPHCCQASKSTTLRLEEGNASVTEMSEKEGAGAGSLDRDANISSIRIHDCNDEQVEPSNGAIDLIGGFSNHLSCTYENSGWIDDVHKLEFAPQLELSLTRYCPTTSKNQEDNERQTLNHCNASAFSRYNNRKSLQPPFPALAGNCNELKERETKSHEQLSNQLSEDTIATDDQHGTAPNNSQGNTSSPATGHSEQVGLASVSGVRFDNICAERNHGSQTIFHTKSCLTPHMGSLRLAYLQEQSPFALGSSDYSSPDNHESEQGYLRSGKTIDYSMDQIVHEPSDVESTREIKEGSPVPGQSTCSTLCNGVASGNNGSAYGSICPDGHVTSAAAVEKGSAPDGRLFIHDVFNHRSSQREAALTKFRLKRKDRCYEKKVRYQSRKTLAEQRPRVKGQFVRQVQNDAPATEAAVCPDTH